MLQQLTAVQEFDKRLDALKDERGQIPPGLTALELKCQDLQTRIDRKRQESEELRRRVAANELELKAMAERRKSASEFALRASSTKEASQYQNQELQFATRIVELEEDTLPLMESLETASGDLAALVAELGEHKPQLEAMKLAEQARVLGVDTRMAEVGAEREALAGRIDAPLLRQYEQARKARKGIGLVPIAANSRCAGCNVRLPLHVVQKARKGDGLTRCPNCGRILMAEAPS